jgi:hypothetical protein
MVLQIFVVLAEELFKYYEVLIFILGQMDFEWRE